ncbi:hypothetical protein [Mesorhizobium silamurunense]|uniref:hypothetical protein n=1 Tax=Mesorhizobium silamurunense TaxID=499528 RepID=UPI00178303DA|nr:hypothetical protein [Mesorhizobium silamurunense]
MDDTRTKASDAAYAFISEPNRKDELNPFLVLIGCVNMLFPQVAIDWDAASLIADAVAKMEHDG